MQISLDEAIKLLRKAVKYSHIDGQKHIDLSLVDANELPRYQSALVLAKDAVRKGELTEAELYQRLNLLD